MFGFLKVQRQTSRVCSQLKSMYISGIQLQKYQQSASSVQTSPWNIRFQQHGDDSIHWTQHVTLFLMSLLCVLELSVIFEFQILFCL